MGTSVTFRLIRLKTSPSSFMAFDFDAPLFKTQQALACAPGLTHNNFKQLLKRRQLNLTVAGDIGRGKRPLYRGMDVAQIALRQSLSPHGLVQAKFSFIWLTVATRIRDRSAPLSPTAEGPMAIFFYLHPQSGSLHMRRIDESAPTPLSTESGGVPDFHLYFRVDSFIDKLVIRMERVLKELPAEPPISPEETRSCDGEFSIDAEGRRVLIGLTHEETLEYVSLFTSEQDSESTGTPASDRFRDLEVAHCTARAHRDVWLPKYKEAADFNGHWETIGNDRKPRGLSFDETAEYLSLAAKSLAHGYSHHCPYLSREESKRHEKLRERNHFATIIAHAPKPDSPQPQPSLLRKILSRTKGGVK